MFDYRAEVERRIEQFAHYLKPMHDRAHEEAHGPCFIIFEERRPGGGSGNEELSEEKKLALELVGQAFTDAGIGGAGTLDESVLIDLPDEGWRQDDSQNRFIQFSFERDWFCTDMPLDTLYRPEAEEILRNRQGFFYLRDRSNSRSMRKMSRGMIPSARFTSTATSNLLERIWLTFSFRFGSSRWIRGSTSRQRHSTASTNGREVIQSSEVILRSSIATAAPKNILG